MLRVDDQAFRTDTGRQRSENEDSLFVRAPIFVVADGMGGAQAGEVASKTAADAFDRDLPEGPPGRFLRETIEVANRRINELARADPSKAGMGTTITAAIVDAQAEEVDIGHVGDSRAYRLRRGKLERLTRDHSLVEEMLRKGQITDAQAEDHPQRSIITRALGPEPDVEVDLQTVPAAPGDLFLLCSDGLTTMVSEERIAAVLAAAGSMREAVRTLVDEANAAGGRDNITALAFRLGDAAAPLGEAPEDATLVGAAAEEAGLTATEVRRRAAAAAAQGRREQLAAKSPAPPPAHDGEGAGGRRDRGGARLRRLVRQPPGLVPRHRRQRPRRPLPRPPLRTSLRPEALRRALREPGPDGRALQQAPRRGQRPRRPLARRRRLADRRNRTQPGDSLRSAARNRELVALIPVALLLSAGFAAVFAQENARLGNLSLVYGAYFLAVCVATHVFLRMRLPNADPYLFPLVALLTAFGLVMVYRIDEGLARDQANWFVLGLVLFALTIQLLRDYDVLERYRYTIAAVGLLLLLAPRLPGIGEQVNGAYLGVKLGPLAFQPAEFSKICIVVFLASYLRENREVLIVGARRVLGVTLPPLKHLGPLLVVWGASMFMLVFIRDLGSSLMFFAAFLALLYVATGRFSFVVIGMALFLVGAWFFASTVPHVHDRVEIWLNPYHDPTGSGYQILQSIFAQADGGLFGKGFGQALITIPGTHAALLPAAQTDTIYSLIVNELGLFGACAVILIYLLIAARGFKIALLADDGFSKLLATGLTAVFAIQAFVIIGGVTQGDPADRRHPALHQLRRQLDRRQLRPPGAAPADLRPGPPRGDGAARGLRPRGRCVRR